MKNKEVTRRVKDERNNLHTIKQRKANLDWSHIAKEPPSETLTERQKGREDEEEDVSSYWKTLRKRGDIGN